MTHRPTIDTLEAKRALEEAGLDPGVCEVLLRLIDTGIHNSTVDRAELEKLRTDILANRSREWRVFGFFITILVGVMTLVQFGMSFIQGFF